MEIGKRLTQLCIELGRLDYEHSVREARRVAVRAEIEVLQRLAAEFQRTGGSNAATVPAPVDAAPDGAAARSA